MLSKFQSLIIVAYEELINMELTDKQKEAFYSLLYILYMQAKEKYIILYNAPPPDDNFIGYLLKNTFNENSCILIQGKIYYLVALKLSVIMFNKYL